MKKMKNILWIAACTALSSASVAQAAVITVAAGETNNFNEALDVTAVTVDAGGTLNLLGGALWHTGTANANETFVNGDVVVTGGDHRFGSRTVGAGSVSMIGLGGSLVLDELQTNTLEWKFDLAATGVSTITVGNWAKFAGGSLAVDGSDLAADYNGTIVLFDCKTLLDVFDVGNVSITGIDEYRYTLDQNLDTDQITLTVTPESGTDVFSASEVINSGTLIEAYNAGGSTSGTNVTVNGVLFIGTSTLLDGNSEADAFWGDTGDAAYNALLSSFDYGGGTDLVSLEVGGGNLTVGTEYTIQVWYVDHLNPGRQTPVGDGESPPSKVVLNSSGQFATSTFVAEASTQTLTLESPGFENAYITAYQIRDPGPGPDWESVMALGDLTNAPIMRANDTNDVTITVSAGETKAIFYDVLDYNGNPTRAYAHLGIPAGASASSQVPAMVLVHGGGQTADDAWVADWTSRGYAAIAISTEGQTDVEATQEQKDAGLAVGKWLRHAMPGPSRSGIYGDSGQDINDQWMYHAVADTILAHSLIRSLPEVNADQTGIMGISWGGVITSTTIGIDDRFQFAIPVFGCGDMDNADNGWGRALKGEPMYEDVWDPTLRLGNVTIPILWFSWPGDPNFPIDRFAVSYRAAPGPRMVTLVPGMGHSTAQATARSDTYAFAESVLSTGLPWCEQRLLSINGDDVSVKFWSSKTLTAASLVSTTNSVVTSGRTWVESSITLQDLGNGLWQASTTLPANTTGWMINVTDGSSIVSSGLQESIYDCGTDISPYIKENGGAWQNTFAASLERGDTVQFAPHPNSGGSWSWNGPNGFSASDRSVAITDLLALDGGNYMATYTDPDGTISRRFFEVNVNGADLNVSVGQSTSQSSTASFGGAAELAVDGDTNGDWSNGSVTQTDPNESNAWWQVDLGSELFIGGIKVYNRTDGNIRLSQFTVSVLDREGSSIFSQSFTGYPDPSILIKTGGVIGQFVRIDQDSNNPLSLAEVEVFESGKAPKFSGWIDQYEVSGDDADPTGDPDGDLLNNLTEFALGGNPTNAASVGFSPMLDASGIESNMVHFVYPRRIGAGSELTYILEFCSDLTSDNWTVGDYVELPETGSLNDDFEAVTNRIDTTGKTKEFMRLRVEMGIPPASG